MKTVKFLIIAFVLFNINLIAQSTSSNNDKDIFDSKIKLAKDSELNSKPINEVIAEIGKSFVGTEYVAHTLEKEGDESLVINLSGLDCTTFLENALVLARCIKYDKTSFDDYQKELTFVRYRDGKIDGYPSRLHYFSDWIFNNGKKRTVVDVTKALGGKLYDKKVEYMTTHRESYKQIAKNEEFYNIIKQQEEEINKREHYFIPKAMIKSVENKIKSGFLIAITTDMEGMDIAHVGIAVKMDDGRIHFLHAPLSGSKVQITDVPLYDYLQKNKKQNGIMVLQPIDIVD